MNDRIVHDGGLYRNCDQARSLVPRAREVWLSAVRRRLPSRPGKNSDDMIRLMGRARINTKPKSLPAVGSFPCQHDKVLRMRVRSFREKDGEREKRLRRLTMAQAVREMEALCRFPWRAKLAQRQLRWRPWRAKLAQRQLRWRPWRGSKTPDRPVPAGRFLTG